MAEVGVHLEDELRTGLQGLAKAGEVRLGQAFLARAVEHLHLRVLAGELVGQPAGAVRRVVVDHEYVQAKVVLGRDGEDALHGQRQSLALVVGGEDDGPHGRILPAVRKSRPSGALGGISVVRYRPRRDPPTKV